MWSCDAPSLGTRRRCKDPIHTSFMWDLPDFRRRSHGLPAVGDDYPAGHAIHDTVIAPVIATCGNCTHRREHDRRKIVGIMDLTSLQGLWNPPVEEAMAPKPSAPLLTPRRPARSVAINDPVAKLLPARWRPSASARPPRPRTNGRRPKRSSTSTIATVRRRAPLRCVCSRRVKYGRQALHPGYQPSASRGRIGRCGYLRHPVCRRRDRLRARLQPQSGRLRDPALTTLPALKFRWLIRRVPTRRRAVQADRGSVASPCEMLAGQRGTLPAPMTSA